MQKIILLQAVMKQKWVSISEKLFRLLVPFFSTSCLQHTIFQIHVETKFLPQCFCVVVKLCISDVVKDGQHILARRRKLFYLLFIDFIYFNSAHQPLFLSTSQRSVTSNVLFAETLSKGHRAKPQMEMGTDPQTFGTPLLCTMQMTGLLYPPTPTLASPSVSHVNPTKN